MKEALQLMVFNISKAPMSCILAKNKILCYNQIQITGGLASY
jgi:hypothetical protein